MILLAAERGLVAGEIAAIVRQNEETVRRRLARYEAEGAAGLSDAPRAGAPPKITPAYRERPSQVVRQRPRSLGLPSSLWTAARLAGHLAEATGLRISVPSVHRLLRAGGMAPSRPQHAITSPDPEHAVKKKAVEDARDGLSPGEVFCYADGFNISWRPTLRAMWSPKGQPVMIPTPMQPTRRYGPGAVDGRTGETVVPARPRERRREVAELLEALLGKHPRETVHVAWDNASTHEDEEVEATVRGAAGRLVLLCLPTYSPGLSPIEVPWRHYRREVTHGEPFDSVDAPLRATAAFFDRCNRTPGRVHSIIGAHPA
jgi:transposase